MPIFTTQLDRIERSLPTVPSRIVRFQRVVAGATYDQLSAAMQTIVDATRNVAGRATGEVAEVVDADIDAVDEHPKSGTPYEQWTKAELLERAKQLGIEGRYGLNKQQLISTLRNA